MGEKPKADSHGEEEANTQQYGAEKKRAVDVKGI
jgi:hypothetical protein